MELRQFQYEAVDALREVFRVGGRRVILQAPTGAGKTVIASHIIRQAEEKGSRILFLAHRRELVKQCASKLYKFGVDHGVIMSGEFLQMEFEVQVASIDSLREWSLSSGRIPLPKADIVFIDEAHRSLSPTYLKMIEAYPDAIVIGMTATPVRTDGRGLGDVYTHMVRCPSVAKLIKLGYLVQPEYYAPTIPDLTGVKITAGDYNSKQLEEAMNHRELVGDIVSHWHRLAADRPTIVFASGVDHSIHLCEEFRKSGARAIHIDGTMGKPERDDAIRGLKSGQYQVVTNCMVLTEGFDLPKLSACVLARPTKSLGLYLQMAGRTLRPEIGKQDTLIIDHSGNVYQHGLIEDPREWALEESKTLHMEREKKQRERAAKTITCVNCAMVYEGQVVCPGCGHKPERQGKWYETRNGELNKLDKRQRVAAKKVTYSLTDKQRWYRMFRFHAEDKGKKIGWAAHAYKRKFKEWPPRTWTDQTYIETPTPECKSYIRSMGIAYAKGKAKAKERGEQRV